MSFCVYCLRNNNGEYISMSGDLTKDWLKASKFSDLEIERRLKYVDEKFKLVKFEVTEIN